MQGIIIIIIIISIIISSIIILIRTFLHEEISILLWAHLSHLRVIH